MINMKKNAGVILSVLELVGLVVILFAMPAETTGQIIAKSAVGLIWLSAFFVFRKYRIRKPDEKDDKK